MLIKADTLYDGRTVKANRTITVEGSRITEVGTSGAKPDFKGVVTPAFIDPHSHIGMARYADPGDEEEANDETGQFLPVNNALNSIYFDDRAFTEAVDFGVLYSCVVPGSGNLLGGKAMIIRNFARDRAGALLKDYGYKMALGYNPRSTVKWKGTRPNTRMGIYGMLEQKFDSVLRKKEKADLARDKKLSDLEDKAKKEKYPASRVKKEKDVIGREYGFEFDAEDEAVLEILVKKRTAKVHVHKEDDILFLLELAGKYGLNVTVDHAADVHRTEVFNMVAKRDIPVVYGPIGAFPYKVELKNESYRNVKKLMDSRAFYGLMTDHPVILTPMLRDMLKYFLIFGMKPAEAVSLITLKNARILGIDDILGSVEKGKTASLVVWDKDPLHLSARPLAVIAEGKVIRKGV